MKIAIVTDDIIGEYMGAAGLRYLHFARHFREGGQEVEFFSHSEEDQYQEFRIYQPEDFLDSASKFDVALAGTLTRRGLSGLKRFKKPIIHDLICPFFLENLRVHEGMPELKKGAWEEEFLADFLELSLLASTYLVASERQRLFWAGLLVAAGVWHSAFSDPPPVVVLPNGIEEGAGSDEDTETSCEAMEIADEMRRSGDTRWLVTNGGLYRWTEVEPIIEALKVLTDEDLDVGLVILGASHPSHPEQSRAGSNSARKLIADLGLDNHVILSDWLPHRSRFKVLKQASLGVHLHRQGLETDLSYRTRLLDFAAAGVPLVASPGGVVSDRMIAAGLLTPVSGLDSGSLAEVIRRALETGKGSEFQSASREFKREWRWSAVLPDLDRALELVLITPSPGETLKGLARGGSIERLYRSVRTLLKRFR